MSRNFTVDDFIVPVKNAELSGTVRPVHVDNDKQVVVVYDRNRGAFFAVPFTHSFGNPKVSRDDVDVPLVGRDYYPLFVENIFENVPEVMEFFNKKIDERFGNSKSPYIYNWKSQLEEKSDGKKES